MAFGQDYPPASQIPALLASPDYASISPGFHVPISAPCLPTLALLCLPDYVSAARSKVRREECVQRKQCPWALQRCTGKGDVSLCHLNDSSKTCDIMAAQSNCVSPLTIGLTPVVCWANARHDLGTLPFVLHRRLVLWNKRTKLPGNLRDHGHGQPSWPSRQCIIEHVPELWKC